MKFHVDAAYLGGVTTNYTADDDDDPGQSLDGTLNFLVGVLIVVTLAFLFLVRRVRNIRRDAETARRLRLERISAHHRAEYGPAFRGDDAISVLQLSGSLFAIISIALFQKSHRGVDDVLCFPSLLSKYQQFALVLLDVGNAQFPATTINAGSDTSKRGANRSWPC